LRAGLLSYAASRLWEPLVCPAADVAEKIAVNTFHIIWQAL